MPTTTPDSSRPAERLNFSRRELLTSSFSERLNLSQAEQGRFAYQNWLLEMSLRNAGQSVERARVMEGIAADAENPPPPLPSKPIFRPH